MRLRRLDLTRYGKFTDTVIEFGEEPSDAPDFHIVYGLNESGKSTSLAAYLDLLFGIEERSRYSFLHQYGAMRIGARLEFSGGEHDLVRLKQRNNSLLDGKGRPVAEGLLEAPLAGLTRDAYRTMFSLDDETLEQGGDEILQSKGDLGRLLFSASAGLGEVSTILSAIGDEANAIYRKRARSTDLAVCKQQLAELKTRREEIDTLVSTYAALVGEHGAASAAYDEAMLARTSAKARHDVLGNLMRALPLLDQRQRLLDGIDGALEAPTVPREWETALPGLMEDEIRLATRMAGLDAETEKLTSRIEALDIDELLLSQASRISALSEGRARYVTAEKDLPSRRAALSHSEAGLAAILALLDQQGHPDPRQLVIPAATAGSLLDLIEARSGLDATLAAAKAELKAAEASLRAARLRASTEADHPAPMGTAVQAQLEYALKRARASDHKARLQLSTRAKASAQAAFDTHRRALSPWQGNGAELEAIGVPSPRRMEGWRTRHATIEKRQAESRDRLRELAGKTEAATARRAALEGALGLIDDQEANRVRVNREAAWAKHLADLDLPTAEVFEQTMRADDGVREARLHNARDVAELRQLALSLAETLAAANHHGALAAEAEAELAALHEEILSEAPPLFASDSNVTADVLLAGIESWTARRQEALEASEKLVEAERDVEHAKRDGAELIDLLASAMQAAGLPSREYGDAVALMEAVETALARHQEARVNEAAAAHALSEREGELSRRRQALSEAEDALSHWQEEWQGVLARTWFGEAASGTGAVRHILEALTRLTPALAERDELAHRIAAMEQDQQKFAAELGEILAAPGQTLSPSASAQAGDDLVRRLERAQRDRETRTALQHDSAALEDERRLVQRELAIHEARKDEMLGFFDVASLTEVSQRFEQLRRHRDIEERIAGIEEQLLATLRVKTPAEAEAALAGLQPAEIEAERDELAARLVDLDQRTRQLFADSSRARDRLDAVGGDKAVAMLESQRRTLLLDIEEKAVTHLRLRAGVLAAEKALLAYKEKHRSSMMKRASDAFRLITKGQYSALAVQPGKDGETLIGVPQAGGSKLAEEMSKGTRFQLYLALRLAGYAEFSETRASVPFIADDIMETFDEPRSEEVLRLFAQMGRIGQVIYLTHHRHLCELARTLIPGVRIHELA